MPHNTVVLGGGSYIVENGVGGFGAVLGSEGGGGRGKLIFSGPTSLPEKKMKDPHMRC